MIASLVLPFWSILNLRSALQTMRTHMGLFIFCNYMFNFSFLLRRKDLFKMQFSSLQFQYFFFCQVHTRVTIYLASEWSHSNRSEFQFNLAQQIFFFSLWFLHLFSVNFQTDTSQLFCTPPLIVRHSRSIHDSSRLLDMAAYLFQIYFLLTFYLRHTTALRLSNQLIRIIVLNFLGLIFHSRLFSSYIFLTLPARLRRRGYFVL